MDQSMTFRITNLSLCGKKKTSKFKGSHPAVLRSCKAAEVQRTERKHEIRVGCDWLFLSNSSTHCVRSSRPAALHLAKDKANRGGRRCEGWRWMGPPQGRQAHAGCDVYVCKCVCVRLPSWAQCGGHSTNITEAYLKLYILCAWLDLFFFLKCGKMHWCLQALP